MVILPDILSRAVRKFFWGGPKVSKKELTTNFLVSDILHAQIG